MRTKQYLAALCLPMAFAACSDEEFVTESPSLDSRGTVNVVLNAQKPIFDTPNTRMGIDEDSNLFLWEKDVDMIGAALVDGATKGTIKDEVFVNYPFTAQEEGNVSSFNSKSAISEGHYLFYYGYADHLGRGKMDLSLPEQTYKVGGKDAIQQAVNYMKMVSPIVNLANGVGYNEAQAYNLNLSFVNLYTMVKVVITPTNISADATPKVEKVLLTPTGGGFVNQAFADMEALSDSKSNVVAPEADTRQIDVEEMATAKAAIEELVGAAGNATVSTIYNQDGVDGSKKTGAAVLNIDGDLTLTEGETTALYILVPKGKYDGLTLTIETNEGTYERVLTPSAGGKLELANQIQPISADMNFATEGGNVEVYDNFSIASEADWNKAINYVKLHLENYAGVDFPTFTLTKDLTIASLPDYSIAIAGDHTLTISSDFTFTNSPRKPKIGSDVTLAVADNVTLTLDHTITCAIVNNVGGKVIVNADQDKKITNYGNLTINDAAISGGIENGKAGEAAVEGTITIAEGKTVTVSSALLDNIAGSITVNGTLTNDVASENKGQIIVGANGVLTGSAAITNTGTIDNSGKLAVALANASGTVIVKDGSFSDNGTSTITGGVVVVKNVTTFGKLQSDGSAAYTFSGAVVTTEVSSQAEYAAADDSSAGITNITLNGGEWTLAGSSGNPESKTIEVPGNATGLTLKGAGLVLEVGLTNVGIVVDGTSSITAGSPMTITGASVTVNANAALTVGNNVQINALDGYTGFDAEILGNLTVETGAKMYFASATVGSAESNTAVLTVNGNTEATDAGEFGVQGTFTNYGSVKSVKGYNTAGKASPVTAGDGTFYGVPFSFNFTI